MNTVITDILGRQLLIIGDNGRVSVARYPDLDEECKQMIIDIYEDVIGEKNSELIEFLNYNDTETEFCS